MRRAGQNPTDVEVQDMINKIGKTLLNTGFCIIKGTGSQQCLNRCLSPVHDAQKNGKLHACHWFAIKRDRIAIIQQHLNKYGSSVHDMIKKMGRILLTTVLQLKGQDHNYFTVPKQMIWKCGL
jgi:hypothetical protein